MQSVMEEKSNFEHRPFYGAKLRKKMKSLAYDGILYSKSGVAIAITLAAFKRFLQNFSEVFPIHGNGTKREKCIFLLPNSNATKCCIVYCVNVIIVYDDEKYRLRLLACG